MFNRLAESPADLVLSTFKSFLEDKNTNKINLCTEIFINKSGVLKSVKQAEKIILASEKTTGYLDSEGEPYYNQQVQKLIFGEDFYERYGHRLFTAQTPGGSAALHMAAEFILQNWAKTTVWLSDPTQDNHHHIFNKMGLPTKVYPYYDYQLNQLKEKELLEKLEHIPEGDTLLFQVCAHNPCGEDLPFHLWEKIATACKERGLLLLLDFAYQGIAQSIELDRLPLRYLLDQALDFMVAHTFSNNMGLYNERVGSLTFVTQDQSVAHIVGSQIKSRIRANYFYPPAHGALIVNTVFETAALYDLWQEELSSMRDFLKINRQLFLNVLADYKLEERFAFIARQQGMFSLLNLTLEQIEQLRQQYSIYLLNSGRINVTGLNVDNIPYFATCLSSVLI